MDQENDKLILRLPSLDNAVNNPRASIGDNNLVAPPLAYTLRAGFKMTRVLDKGYG